MVLVKTVFMLVLVVACVMLTLAAPLEEPHAETETDKGDLKTAEFWGWGGPFGWGGLGWGGWGPWGGGFWG